VASPIPCPRSAIAIWLFELGRISTAGRRRDREVQGQIAPRVVHFLGSRSVPRLDGLEGSVGYL
jgi:hypothetical protein